MRARDLINDCRERLAAHDRYVAGFYWKRHAWRGAAGRLLELADAYGDLQDGRLRGDSLWRAAVAYYNAKDFTAERTVLTRLVQESPNDSHRKEAEALLKTLPSWNAPPPAAAPLEQKPVEVPTAPPIERPESAPKPGEPVGAPAPKPEK